MTNDPANVTPAGWYPDPSGDPTQRWWDGVQWTQHVAPAPAQVAPSQALEPRPYGEHVPTVKVPEGTPTSTPWIWLVALLPLLGLISLATFDPTRYVVSSADPLNPLAPYAIFVDPWYLGTVALSFVLYGVVVLCAALDHSALGRLGYASRFHWAWAFLSSFVYVIGRSVVVRRQSGRGLAPMWTAIGVNVAAVIIAIVWSVWVVIASIGAVTEVVGY